MRERDYFTRVDHPEAGAFDYPAGPYKAEGMSWKLEPAPLLGQHNREILCERLGYSQEDLVRLRESCAI